MKFRFSEDAIEAKQQLNHTVIGGREIRIVFAEENRKTPQEMRSTSRSRFYDLPSNFYFAVPFWFKYLLLKKEFLILN